MSRRDTKHYSQSLVPVAKVAWRSPFEFLQSFDATGEVAAVVRKVPHMIDSTPQSGLV